MKIYKTTDKIAYKLGELEIKISPLSVDDKTRLTELMMKGQEKKDFTSIMESSIYALQCALKEVNGLEYNDGKKFEIEFDQNGKVKKELIDDLMNIEQTSKLIELCASFINGIPSNLPEGIELVKN